MAEKLDGELDRNQERVDGVSKELMGEGDRLSEETFKIQ